MDENRDLEQLEADENKQVEPEKTNDKKKTAVTAAICVAVIAVAVIVAVFVIKSGGGNNPTENNSESASQEVSYEAVTDESGEAVTDTEGNTVTQAVPVNQGGSGGNSGGNNGGGSGNEVTTAQPVTDINHKETTTSKKAEKRKLQIYVVAPLENGAADTAIVYVNGEEDCRFNIALDGKEYFVETAEKYKGDAEVKVELEKYGTFWTLTIGELYDTETFVLPLNHVEDGYAEID